MRQLYIASAIVALTYFVAGCTPPHRNRHTFSHGASTPARQRTTKDYRYTTYYVQDEDTLYSIARKMNVPAERIKKANHCNPSSLQVDQVLLIPVHARQQKPLPSSEPADEHRRTRTRSAGNSPQNEKTKKSQLHRGNPSANYWWPVSGRLLRQYGDRTRGFPEPGIGINARKNQSVHAINTGTIICAIQPGTRSGWGKVVAIKHNQNTVSWYGHLGSVKVRPGQHIEKGEAIGTVSPMPNTSEPHLAFRFFRNERPVDPLKYLPDAE